MLHVISTLLATARIMCPGVKLAESGNKSSAAVIHFLQVHWMPLMERRTHWLQIKAKSSPLQLFVRGVNPNPFACASVPCGRGSAMAKGHC